MPEVSKIPIDVFAEARKLGFPASEYILVGSAILAAKGIRDAYDLDIVVSPGLFKRCKSEGWTLLPWTKSGMTGKPWLRKEGVDLMLECVCKDATYDFDQLVAEGVQIGGIWFLSLNQLIRFKKDYGRPKDFDDVALIERFLSS